jgi:hypothetical protein
VASASAGRAGFTSYTDASGTVTTENFSSDSSNLAGFNDEMGYDEEDSFEDPLFSGMALSMCRAGDQRSGVERGGSGSHAGDASDCGCVFGF